MKQKNNSLLYTYIYGRNSHQHQNVRKDFGKPRLSPIKFYASFRY